MIKNKYPIYFGFKFYGKNDKRFKISSNKNNSIFKIPDEFVEYRNKHGFNIPSLNY